MAQILVKDIPENKLWFFVELINNLGFKAETNTPSAEIDTAEKSGLYEELREAVENVKLVKSGKLRAKPLEELLDEI